MFDAGLNDMLADIRGDLSEFGVRFDRWYSEQDLGNGRDGGPIDRALARLRAAGHAFDRDGATWFRATQFGDEKDRARFGIYNGLRKNDVNMQTSPFLLNALRTDKIYSLKAGLKYNMTEPFALNLSHCHNLHLSA